MIGAIIGDIVGSRFEFNNRLSKDFRFFTYECDFTDDTVMTCAGAKAIMDCAGDYSDLSEKAVSAMQEIGRQFLNCGYGRKFIDWMFSPNPQPYDSCGNGSAMRVSAAGFAAQSIEEAKKISAAVTRISHNHPEGMKGAEATAVAIFLARQGKTKDEIRQYVESEYSYDLGVSVEEYRNRWGGHGKEICQASVPQAFACFLEGESYEDVIRNCISIGGDSDTIAAIAGGIAEAYYGVPEDIAAEAKSFLAPVLLEIVESFEEKHRESADYVPGRVNFETYREEVRKHYDPMLRAFSQQRKDRYFMADEAQMHIRNEFRTDCADYQAGRISERELMEGGASAVGNCLSMMFE